MEYARGGQLHLKIGQMPDTDLKPAFNPKERKIILFLKTKGKDCALYRDHLSIVFDPFV
jgi:hypothetical protein